MLKGVIHSDPQTTILCETCLDNVLYRCLTSQISFLTSIRQKCHSSKLDGSIILWILRPIWAEPASKNAETLTITVKRIVNGTTCKLTMILQIAVLQSISIASSPYGLSLLYKIEQIIVKTSAKISNQLVASSFSQIQQHTCYHQNNRLYATSLGMCTSTALPILRLNWLKMQVPSHFYFIRFQHI